MRSSLRKLSTVLFWSIFVLTSIWYTNTNLVKADGSSLSAETIAASINAKLSAQTPDKQVSLYLLLVQKLKVYENSHTFNPVVSNLLSNLVSLLQAKASALQASIAANPTTATAAVAPTTSITLPTLPNIDMDAVRAHLVKLYNDYRTNCNLGTLTQNTNLVLSATDRANTMRDAWTASHRRHAGDAYYDYNLITQWFGDRGLTFTNVGGWTYTENIGYGYLGKCTSDCTTAMIAGIDQVRAMYVGEAATGKCSVGGSGSPHFNSIVAPKFTAIGLGVALAADGKKFFTTMHLATSVSGSYTTP